MSIEGMRLRLGTRWVGPGEAPFIIAEMSGNHNGSLERALKIVDAAAESGVDALKLQTYTADTMTLNLRKPGFVIEDPSSLWHGKTLYELYREAATPWEWHAALYERCRKRRLACFSTPFDSSAVDFLEKLGTPFYKIASFENTDFLLIRKVCSTGKPVILSTGMMTSEELKETVGQARHAGCKELLLLKCTSIYPSQPEEANLLAMAGISKATGCPVGLSDHTLGAAVSLAAVALGACVIEKHFTLSRRDEGVDSAFSMEPAEMASLVRDSRAVWKALGSPVFSPTEKEKASMAFRRSIYVTKDLKAGDTLNHDNMRCIRPGFGLPPKHYESLLGKKVKKNVRAGTPLQWEICDDSI